MAIAGAVIAAVTAIYGTVSKNQQVRKARAASLSAQQARASNAEVNALFSAAKPGSLAQAMMSLSSSPAPRGVPPWMSGQA